MDTDGAQAQHQHWPEKRPEPTSSRDPHPSLSYNQQSQSPESRTAPIYPSFCSPQHLIFPFLLNLEEHFHLILFKNKNKTPIFCFHFLFLIYSLKSVYYFHYRATFWFSGFFSFAFFSFFTFCVIFITCVLFFNATSCSYLIFLSVLIIDKPLVPFTQTLFCLPFPFIYLILLLFCFSPLLASSFTQNIFCVIIYSVLVLPLYVLCSLMILGGFWSIVTAFPHLTNLM